MSRAQATLWTPVMSTPLVRMLCHRGPVSALAVDPEGRYMASSGLDGRLKVWDLRTYKMVHSYVLRTPATAIDISQRGLMSVACCGRVQIWKDALAIKAPAPYLEHSLPAGAQVRERVQHSASACALLVIPIPFVSTGTSPAISTVRRFLGHWPLQGGQLDRGTRRWRAEL